MTLICEEPKLAPYKAEISSLLTGVLSAPVNVKASTNEGMGAIGRGEGIACMAVALVDTGDELQSGISLSGMAQDRLREGLTGIASRLPAALGDLAFELKTFNEVGLIRPMRPDKLGRVAERYFRLGASPALGVRGERDHAHRTASRSSMRRAA